MTRRRKCSVDLSRLENSIDLFQTTDDHLNVLYHPEHFKGPILFSFRSKAFFGKKKAMIRVEDGEWSDKFSIDVAGSEGVVACKYNGMTYQVRALTSLLSSFRSQYVSCISRVFLIDRCKRYRAE